MAKKSKKEKALPTVPEHSEVAAAGIPRSQVSSTVGFAENIVLLEWLDPKPGSAPTDSPVKHADHHHIEDSVRCLSIDEEMGLATNLAFLAGISNDKNHIIAISVEEVPKTGGCKVLVAVNRRASTDGAGVLQKVQEGLERMFVKLSKMSSASREVIKDELFNDIIELCYSRIMRRLGLVSSDRRFIGEVLEDFIAALREKETKGASHDAVETRATLEGCRRKSEKLLEELRDFASAAPRNTRRLSKLVGFIARYWKAVPLERVLHSFSDKEMQQNLRQRLTNCLSKIARYRQCASYLCRKTQRIPMLQKTVVEQVHLARGAYEVPSRPNNTTELSSALARYEVNGHPVHINGLPRWLQIDAMASQNSFANKVNKVLEEAKVHAEIQILAHYEDAGTGVVAPRVIASSKDACFLCKSTIHLHGKFRVPKSHGKLYKGWRLPAIYQKGPVQRELNAYLEREISATLRKLVLESKRPVTMFSNESTIFPINVSASTLTAQSVSGFPNAGRVEEASAGMLDEVADEISAETQHIEDVEVMGFGIRDAHSGGNERIGIAREADVDKKEAVMNGSSRSINIQSLSVEEPDIGHKIVFQPKMGGRTWFRTRQIELVIDDSSGRFSFEILGQEEVTEVLRDRANLVVDVNLLVAGAADVTLPKGPDGDAYLSCGGEIIRICTSKS